MAGGGVAGFSGLLAGVTVGRVRSIGVLPVSDPFLILNPVSPVVKAVRGFLMGVSIVFPTTSLLAVVRAFLLGGARILVVRVVGDLTRRLRLVLVCG